MVTLEGIKELIRMKVELEFKSKTYMEVVQPMEDEVVKRIYQLKTDKGKLQYPNEELRKIAIREELNKDEEYTRIKNKLFEIKQKRWELDMTIQAELLAFSKKGGV